ncbi:helix-turn-helix transcriptional regulator [Thalassococcus lentus]|uniref:Helix-turn-helix domain-containing protein n=1 Tax=Thalassococcus lentus TaxID=1210524 RepID=A0ABT4XPE7_9RHOB|nr:helix-turn-helix domain-containing protein [Thalassococcus lentus]MDA7423820.1 helix-turn-helix domain-containing protein [Thalassococcus lentus]
MTDRLLKVSEITEQLAIAEPTVWRWISNGKFPAPIKLGRASRWRQSTIEQWLKEQESSWDANPAQSTAEVGHSN